MLEYSPLNNAHQHRANSITLTFKVYLNMLKLKVEIASTHTLIFSTQAHIIFFMDPTLSFISSNALKCFHFMCSSDNIIICITCVLDIFLDETPNAATDLNHFLLYFVKEQ